jgi:hypothetical protein
VRDVYFRAHNSSLNSHHEFIVPEEALISARFCGLTTLLAAKYLTNRMVIVDEGQEFVIDRVSVSPDDA